MKSAIIVDSSVYALFVIVPVQQNTEFQNFVSILEQVALCRRLGSWNQS